MLQTSTKLHLQGTILYKTTALCTKICHEITSTCIQYDLLINSAEIRKILRDDFARVFKMGCIKS